MACLVASVVAFILLDSYEIVMLMESVLFTLQAIGLLIINADLHMTLSGIFKPAQFKNERRFLKCTLVTFTLSYLFAVGRTFAIYIMIHMETFHIKKWMCQNNFLVNLINIVCYIFIDLIPICTIFYLHRKNFHEEAKKERLNEKL